MIAEKPIEPLAVPTEEAARLCGLSPRHLADLRQRAPHQGPRFRRVGQRVVYRLADLNDWLARDLEGGLPCNGGAE